MNTPLFAKFLENQISENTAVNVLGGDPGNGNGADPCDGPAGDPGRNPHCDGPIIVTLKFPCDQADQGLPC